MTLLVEQIGDLAQSPGLRAEWEALQARASGASLFTSQGWLECWLAVFGGAKVPYVLTVRDGADLVGVAPLIWSRVRRRPWLSMHHAQTEDLAFLKGARRLGCVMPVRQLCVAGNLQSANVRGGPVVAPSHADTALLALFGHLGADETWDVLCLPAFRSDETPSLRVAAARAGLAVGVIPRVVRLYALTARPWPAYVAGRSKHFRKRLRESEGKLAPLGEVCAETVTDQGRTSEALEEMFVLARESWKERGDKDPAVHLPLTPEAKRFYRGLAEKHARNGRSALAVLRVNGRLVAAMLAARDGDVLYLLQTFYSPSAAAVSPGRLLMRQLVDWAAAHGIRRIDTNGTSGLARMFGDESHEYDQVFVFRQSGYSGWLYRLATLLEGLHTRRGGHRTA